MRQVLLTAVALLAVMAPAPAAHADNAKINVQIFRPSPHPGDLLNLELTDVPDGDFYWSVQALFHFGKNPLVFVPEIAGVEYRNEVIQNLFTLDLMGSLSLFGWVDIGLALPIHMLNSGQRHGIVVDQLSDVSGAAIGDIRLSPKIRIIGRGHDEDGFGLAATALFSLPLGLANPDAFVSDGFTFEPTVLADYRVGPFVVGLNVGARFRTGTERVRVSGVKFLEVTHELLYRVGARYTIIDEVLDILGELYGGTSSFTNENMAHLEGVLAVRARLPDLGLQFTVGGGSGFLSGYGNTKFRLFAGVGYAPPIVRDRDGDGFEDDEDGCPDEAEDFDDFEDSDGCPELDNDHDGIQDTLDRCPNDPEDVDGFEDSDGCPDPDNDGDGIEDARDTCPLSPEDKDGFEDEDGCPDTDNDRDGIEDVKDRCPDEPEVFNGFEDEDGCPDQTLAVVEKEKIVILQKVFFDVRKASIRAESFPVLDAVVGVLTANPHIARIRIEGHTDDQGSARFNMKLSGARAESVKAYLVSKGIDEGRLEAVGYGEDRPLMEGKSDEAREKNRRVEFMISEQ